MKLIDWQERLRTLLNHVARLSTANSRSHPDSQSKPIPSESVHELEIDQASLEEIELLINRPIARLLESEFLVIPSWLKVKEALLFFQNLQTELALIQDTQDSIEGVLRLNVAQSVAGMEEQRGGELPVSSVLDRNICIEPDCVSVLEVMERMAFSDVVRTVIVDRLGRPKCLVSPEMICHLLRFTLGPQGSFSEREEEILAQ